MKEWEKRYEHEKDKRDSWCLSLEVKIPKDEKYGSLKIPKGFWKTWKGIPFWKNFKDRGHSAIIFEECICKEKI